MHLYKMHWCNHRHHKSLQFFRSKMPKEIFKTTVERADGENWGLVVSGGKDMVFFIFIIFNFIPSSWYHLHHIYHLCQALQKVMNSAEKKVANRGKKGIFHQINFQPSYEIFWKIQRSSNWTRINVWEREILEINYWNKLLSSKFLSLSTREIIKFKIPFFIIEKTLQFLSKKLSSNFTKSKCGSDYVITKM